ncbi:MAG TPA: endo-1,4-beta-xylanase [Opitutaceae bacterium]
MVQPIFRCLRFRKRQPGAGLGVFLALGATIFQASGQSIPTGGESLVSVDDIVIDGSFRQGSSGGQPVALRTIVDVADQSFAQAARIDVQRPTGQFWDSAVSVPSIRVVVHGDVVLLHVFLRAIQSGDESGSVFCQVYVEGPGPAFLESISQQITAGPDWIEYFLPFAVDGSYATGQFTVNFGFGDGSRPQILELADARVIWYGISRTLDEMPRTSFRYDGREPDAPWRREAAQRIEMYRKADYTIRVVNPAGLPIPGATVRTLQTRHAFLFGTAFQASRIAGRAAAENPAYRNKLVELFNAGSTENDLKWPPWEGDWGSGFSQAQTLEALEWLDDRDFHLRGHVLVWPGFENLPNSITSLLATADPSIPQRVRAHIEDIVTATRDLVGEWDVLNEPYTNHVLMDLFGDDIMVEWFEEARLHHPTARLYINDFQILSGGGVNTGHQDHYENTIRFLIENGAPLDGIGMQGHFDSSPTGIPRVWSILERYAQAFPGLDIKITEFDVDTDDEQLQADYARDFLTLFFSHPSARGFQVWGFWEDAHWRPRAAMYRSNWEEKPNGAAFRDLVHNQWWTDETRATGVDGRIRGRGFHGTYEIDVEVGDQTVNGTYTIGLDGLATDIVIDVPAAPEPNVVAQPFGATVSPGESVVLSFEASGDPAPIVTWYKDGAALDEHGFDLTLNAADPGDEGVYYAEVANALGSTRTREVRIGVRAPGQRTEKLINISTRGQVLTGDNVMIAGFVIDGTGPKDVLVRGVGPRLAGFGVTGVLANPRLRLFRGDEPAHIAENDNWDAALSAVFEQVGAFPLDGDTLSAALRLDLDPGVYSVHLDGIGGGTGVGIIEVYDVAIGAPLKLINISTRGRVGSGPDVLIGGFAINGSVPQRVLVRGVGPQLAAFGVGGALGDPRLTLYGNVNGTDRPIAFNDDWMLGTGDAGAAIASAAETIGAFALDAYGRDASLLLWLEPGSYSVHLAGAADGTGIGLMEIYAAP